MLTGTALAVEARRLAIPGRSKMSAANLRLAIADRLRPVPIVPREVPRHIPLALLFSVGVPLVPPVPFRARNGKHKPSRTRTHRTNAR